MDVVAPTNMPNENEMADHRINEQNSEHDAYRPNEGARNDEFDEHAEQNAPIKKVKRYTRKQIVRKVTTTTLLSLIEVLQCVTPALIFKHHTKIDLFMVSSLIVTYCLFFYKRRYFSDIQPLGVANYIFAVGLTIFVIEYDLNHFFSYIGLPIFALGMLAANVTIPKFNDLYPLVLSLNAFHQMSKYSSMFKWYASFSFMGVYVILQVFLYWKKRRLGIYICRVVNFYQIHSLLLDMFLRAHKVITETHNRDIKGTFDIPSVYYANIIFGLAILVVSLLKIPRVRRTTEEKGTEDNVVGEEEHDTVNIEAFLTKPGEKKDCAIKDTGNETQPNYDVPTPQVSTYVGWEESKQEEIDSTGFKGEASAIKDE